MSIKRDCSWIVTLALLLAGSALAQTPVGPEFQVNSYTTELQTSTRVAHFSDGGFVVVWASAGSSGSDSSGFSVLGQLYDGSGAAQGAEFQINSFTPGDQYYPSVAADGADDFVVAWDSLGSPGSDSSGYSIQAQRFDRGASPLGAQFQVNSYTNDGQYRPDVAADADGSFVVIWTSVGSDEGDNSGESVHAQLYDAGGVPAGSQFQVNSTTGGCQRFPAVALDGSSQFVITWESDSSAGSDSDGVSIQGQRYDDGGLPLGVEFQVNSYTTDDQERPAIAADGAGDFVITWQSDGSYGPDTSNRSVLAQAFDNLGNASGGELSVNAYTTLVQDMPAIAAEGSGNFVVTWTSQGSYGSDANGRSIQGRRVSASGVTRGPQFQVNSFTTGNQDLSAVAFGEGGSFVVVWRSPGVDPDDAILAQRLTTALFADGFESGDTDSWSMTVE